MRQSVAGVSGHTRNTDMHQRLDNIGRTRVVAVLVATHMYVIG